MIPHTASPYFPLRTDIFQLFLYAGLLVFAILFYLGINIGVQPISLRTFCRVISDSPIFLLSPNHIQNYLSNLSLRIKGPTFAWILVLEVYTVYQEYNSTFLLIAHVLRFSH